MVQNLRRAKRWKLKKNKAEESAEDTLVLPSFCIPSPLFTLLSSRLRKNYTVNCETRGGDHLEFINMEIHAQTVSYREERFLKSQKRTSVYRPGYMSWEMCNLTRMMAAPSQVLFLPMFLIQREWRHNISSCCSGIQILTLEWWTWSETGPTSSLVTLEQIEIAQLRCKGCFLFSNSITSVWKYKTAIIINI